MFSNGKLTSYDLAPASNAKSKFSSECVVERIILLGHSSGPKNAQIEPASQKVEIVLGPLKLEGQRGSSIVTVRKPNVRIADDWTIKIL